GEADHYENFHSSVEIGPGYHGFVFDLVRDENGNFYFTTSGRKAPTIGEVIRVSPDGTTRTVVATRFRHPNGMGAGGPRDWLLVADNVDGKFPAGASVVREGASYGFGGPRTVPFLFVLPPEVDTSSGSQCWADPQRWGPLSSSILHTSYSKSSLTYVVTQMTDSHPNGFSVKFPYKFRSGVMRLEVSPRDGQPYVIGQRGWDTGAGQDGSLTRVRYTGKPAYVIQSATASPQGIRLEFSTKIDASSVAKRAVSARRVGAGQPVKLEVRDVRVAGDNAIVVDVEGNDPELVRDRKAEKKHKDSPRYKVIGPIELRIRLKASDGTKIRETLYATINGF
ncbi:MAG: hypothetical protein AAF517_19780, partial [Planctomycetota bacterium]